MCSPGGGGSSQKVQDIPDRQPLLMPDGGDPLVRAALRGSGKLRTSAMIFANRSGAIGAPSVAAPLGTRGM